MSRSELVLGNIFVRPNPLERKGDMVGGHLHHFDHVTFVTRGGVHIDATLPDGQVRKLDVYAPGHAQYNGQWFVLIKAEVLHEITALEDHSEFFCVYAHREPQGRVVEHYTGWHEAYS